MNSLLVRWTKIVATSLERLLALLILAGIIVYSYESAIQMLAMDWGSIETFYDFIYRILLVVIAVELIRTLVTHNLTAVLELIAFVVARKMLKPEITSMDILLCAFGFVALLAASKFFLPSPASELKE